MTYNEYKDLIADLDKKCQENNKHLKGYMFDSLVYRYKLARHKMTEMQMEEERKSNNHYYRHDYNYYLN